MSSAAGNVLPNPGIPKTLGILNIIFGVMLVLMGFCMSSYLLVIPFGLQIAEKQQKEQQARSEAEYQTKLKNLDDRLAASKSDDEKKTIAAEKEKEVANPPTVPPDLQALTGMYRNPKIMGYFLGYFGSGMFMNLLLFISGIGLVRMRSWGRKMAMGLASVQILRLIALLVVSLIVVQPEMVVETKKLIDVFEAQAKLNGAPGNVAQTLQMLKATAGLGAVFSVVGFVFCTIYPALTLILLSTAGARAAFLSSKSSDFPETLS